MTTEEKFRAVPKPIRDWFWDDTVDQAIIEIEQYYALPEDEKVIPQLLFAVEVRDLPLSELEGKLASGLALSPNTAHSIYEVIKAKILNPIAAELIAYGIGEKELAVETAASAPLAAVATEPATKAAPEATVPAAPVAVTPVPLTAPSISIPMDSVAAPTPIRLHSDDLSMQQGVVPNPSTSIGGPINSGNLVDKDIRPRVPAPRAAHIDLGSSIPGANEKIESFFVERKTPKMQEIDYGVPIMPQPMPTTPSTGPVPISISSYDSQPGLAAPQPESVSVPTVAQPEDASGGFLSSIMQKIAPWHSAKFSKKRGRATEALEAPLPSESINYSDAPAPQAPQSGQPMQIADLPTPPAA